jgi:ABC-type branched-subunit amino acid transport system substrate-binding protein
VVIGTVGDQSGVVGAIFANGPKGIQAWVKWMNDQGGIDCHPIKYILLDDGGDPSRLQALTQQLVEQDHAIAIVGQDAPLDGQATVSYVTQHRIPMIGSEGAESEFYSTSPMYFPQTSSAYLLLLGALGAARDEAGPLGKTKVGLVSCVEAPLCSTAYTVDPKYASRFGFQIVYNGRVSIVQPDYTANCQAAQAAGAQVFLMYVDGPSIERLARSCASIGYHPIYSTMGEALTSDFPSDSQLYGLLGGIMNIPWFDPSNPGVTQYRSVMAKYAPGLQPDDASIDGWLSAVLFGVAAQHLSDQPTSQDLLNGLWSIQNNDLGGMTAPLTFVKDQPSSPTQLCYWNVKVTAGEYVSPNSSKRTCEGG